MDRSIPMGVRRFAPSVRTDRIGGCVRVGATLMRREGGIPNGCCRYCGEALDDSKFGAVLFSLHLTDWEHTFLRRLVKAAGKPVHYDQLTTTLYGSRHDAPKSPRRLMHVSVSYLNQKITTCGYRVVVIDSFGYFLARMPVQKVVTHGSRSGKYHPDRQETWSKSDILTSVDP